MKCEVKESKFGVLNGADIKAFTLKSDTIKSVILNYGGVIQSLETPDKNGVWDDITTGFETIDEYPQKSQFFGCLVGRYANRIGGAKFVLNGETFDLFKNNGGAAPNFKNSLHGGKKGFDKYVWESKIIENGIELSLVSNHMDEGYPGKLDVTVQYLLIGDQLTIDYSAISDKDTVVNLTNHAYFNLDGHKSWGKLDNHSITLNAPTFTPVDGDAIPTGEMKNVSGSAFDLNGSVQLTQANLAAVDGNNGYDHNWCLKTENNQNLVHAATVTSSLSGRKMKVDTTNPGIQFYTGNFLSGNAGKHGVKYEKQTGYCLETQHFPDTPNQPNFPTATLLAGQKYHQRTVFTLTNK